jgi:hypothetical protein
MNNDKPKAGDIFYTRKDESDFLIITKMTEHFAQFRPIGKCESARTSSGTIDGYNYEITPDMNKENNNCTLSTRRQLLKKKYKLKFWNDWGYHFDLSKTTHLLKYQGLPIKCNYEMN